MNDTEIIDLYFKRDETAISQTDKKYGNDLKGISYRIVRNRSDSEECVNDTYLRVWRNIPPERPLKFFPYLAKIVRNISLNRYEYIKANKRTADVIPLVLNELSYCIPDKFSMDETIDERELIKIIDNFLMSQSEEKAVIFIQRYFYLCSIKEIAAENAISQSKAKMTLLRLRQALKEQLTKEGIEV